MNNIIIINIQNKKIIKKKQLNSNIIQNVKNIIYFFDCNII